MKIKSYRILFRFFSYLSDKTNGAPLFVKYKLLLGTLIIGMSSLSCGKSKPAVTCYDLAAPPDIAGGSIDNAAPLPEIPNDSDLFVTCYDTIAIEDPITIETTCYISIPVDQALPDVFLYGSTDISAIPAEGSPEKFLEWIGGNIRYPESMLREGMQGRVVVDIVIDEDGSLTDIKIVKGLVPEADKEVLRVLSLSQKWTPAENGGQKVKTKITLPVTFRLPKN